MLAGLLVLALAVQSVGLGNDRNGDAGHLGIGPPWAMQSGVSSTEFIHLFKLKQRAVAEPNFQEL